MNRKIKKILSSLVFSLISVLLKPPEQEKWEEALQ